MHNKEVRQFPGPNHYTPNFDKIFPNLRGAGTFGKSARFKVVVKKVMKKRNSKKKKENEKNKKKTFRRSTIGYFNEAYTTKPFQRNPSRNAGSFSKAKRIEKSSLTPGPGNYSPFQKKANPISFPKSKRFHSKKKFSTPSPFDYKVKFIGKKSPSACIPKSKYQAKKLQTPSPASYNVQYLIKKAPVSRFSTAKRWNRPDTPGICCLDYSPNYDFVKKRSPAVSLYKFGF